MSPAASENWLQLQLRLLKITGNINECVPVCDTYSTVSSFYITKQIFRALFPSSHFYHFYSLLDFPAVLLSCLRILCVVFFFFRRCNISRSITSRLIRRVVCVFVEPWRRAGWRGAAGWSERWWRTAERRGEPASSPESSHLAERRRNRRKTHFISTHEPDIRRLVTKTWSKYLTVIKTQLLVKLLNL